MSKELKFRLAFQDTLIDLKKTGHNIRSACYFYGRFPNTFSWYLAHFVKVSQLDIVEGYRRIIQLTADSHGRLCLRNVG